MLPPPTTMASWVPVAAARWICRARFNVSSMLMPALPA
jgi:hypothetical protein